MAASTDADLLWPPYETPDDLAAIEAVARTVDWRLLIDDTPREARR